MQPGDISGLYYPVSSNASPQSAYFSPLENKVKEFHSNQNSNPLCNFNIHPQVQELNQQPSSFSNTSTSDEADDQHLNLINERKQRRMISNRESARRSRMRKQRHLDELLSQVLWLRNEHQQLVEKLNQFSDCHDRVLRENAQLKEETSELRKLIIDMQLKSPYSTLRDLEDIHCNAASPRIATSNKCITNSKTY